MNSTNCNALDLCRQLEYIIIQIMNKDLKYWLIQSSCLAQDFTLVQEEIQNIFWRYATVYKGK